MVNMPKPDPIPMKKLDNTVKSDDDNEIERLLASYAPGKENVVPTNPK